MEIDNSQKQFSQSEKRILPSIKKAQATGKNMMALAKVEFDRNMVGLRDVNRKSHEEAVTTISYHRLTRELPIKHSQSQLSKTVRKLPEVDRKKIGELCRDKNKCSSILLNSQPKEALIQSQMPPIDRAKTSTKEMGTIKGYAVNSHPGPLTNINDDRICVVTNLNKSPSRDLQISFFSIYSCENGIGKAEFFRDNLHPTLAKDKELLNDVEGAIHKAMMEVEDKYKKEQGKGDNSQVSALIALMKGTGAVMQRTRLTLSQWAPIRQSFLQALAKTCSTRSAPRKSQGNRFRIVSIGAPQFSLATC
jgi:hypothetical protein